MSSGDVPTYEWEDFLCRRHPHRLDPEKYRIPGHPVLVTVCAKGARSVLMDARIRDQMIDALPVAAGLAGCQLMAWCLMPDHVHILIRVGPDGGDILRFLHSYKSWTGRVMTEAGIGTAWERSFWDRHSRNSDDVSTLVRYILRNPVRAGLCGTWDEWPYSEYLLQIVDGQTAGRHGS